MSDIIPHKIASEEVLVRFVTSRDFKKKNKPTSADNLDLRNLFCDTRKRGVSLQRYPYASEVDCKTKAMKFKSPNEYIGFVIFSKKNFDEFKVEYLKSRSDFEARILSTPLNENQEYIITTCLYNKSWAGDIAHADLFYLNPAPIESEEPNTAIRSFSDKFARKCKFIFDEFPVHENEINFSFCLQ